MQAVGPESVKARAAAEVYLLHREQFVHLPGGFAQVIACEGVLGRLLYDLEIDPLVFLHPMLDGAADDAVFLDLGKPLDESANPRAVDRV